MVNYAQDKNKLTNYRAMYFVSKKSHYLSYADVFRALSLKRSRYKRTYFIIYKSYTFKTFVIKASLLKM